MAIQKKSLITNLSATKKAVVASRSGISTSPATANPVARNLKAPKAFKATASMKSMKAAKNFKAIASMKSMRAINK